MHAWERIQITLDYLEDHLHEPVSIAELAKMAALSPFYYQRLFCRLCRRPPAEYVKLRRMARAADALRQGSERILDVALSLGYSSHEQFTRTFKQTFGMTPSAYRACDVALNRMTKPELLLKYALIDEGVPLVTDGIVLEIRRETLAAPERFLGYEKTLPVSFMEGLGTSSGIDPLDELWQTFHARKEALGMASDSAEIGVTLMSPEPGCFRYFAGGPSEASSPDAEPWTLPAGRYIVCAFEAESFQALVMDALYKAEQYLFDVWLKDKGIATDPFCAERYASHTPNTTGMEVWVRCSAAGV